MTPHASTTQFRVILTLSVLNLLVSDVCALAIFYKIQEEQAAGSLIGNLIPQANLDRKYDPEVLRRLNFKFISQPQGDGNLVTLDQNTGVIRTGKVIDREAICAMQDECSLQYDVLIGPPEYFEILKVTINIADINDHSPEFLDREITQEIPESTIAGTTFTLPAARDLDGGINGIQSYSLVSDSGIFELKFKTIAPRMTDLRLQVVDHLDREKRDRYELELTAEDGGSPKRNGRLKIHVVILDSNDNEPQFEFSSYEVSVSENTPSGTQIQRVKATDKDTGLNGRIVYSFSSLTQKEYGHIFHIDPMLGDISIRGSLDFEDGAMYILSVEARDQGAGGLTSSTNVVVRVVDTNDRAPEVVINTLSPSGLVDLSENSPRGTFVAHLSVTDADTGDGGTFSCSINNPQFQLQKLFPNEYQIISDAIFDREILDEVKFPITCRDFGDPPQTSITDIVVHVTDENDHVPKFSKDLYSIEVRENKPPGHALLQINASDVDIGRNGRIEYHIGGAAADMFLVDRQSGVITSTSLLDHETLREIEFQVYAVDGGEPPHTATATVVIKVLDENDQMPMCDQPHYEFHVTENNYDVPVGKITAHDTDAFPHNQFHFLLQDSYNASGIFAIDRQTGVLTTRKLLDREGQALYDMLVIVTSTDDRAHTSTCRVSVYVDDENDCDPVFVFPAEHNDTLVISNKSPRGSHIGSLRAIDRDTGPNAELMFAIIGGNNDNTFSMDSSNGKLFLYKDVTERDKTTFALRVEVKDMGEPQNSKSAVLYIAIDGGIVARAHLPYHESASSLLESETLTVILGVAAGVILVLICVALITIFCCCNKKNLSRDAGSEESKEAQQRMLDFTTEQNGHKHMDVKENGVTIIDAVNTKYFPIINGNGTNHENHQNSPVRNHQLNDLKNGHSKSVMSPDGSRQTLQMTNERSHVATLKIRGRQDSPRSYGSNGLADSRVSGEFVSYDDDIDREV